MNRISYSVFFLSFLVFAGCSSQVTRPTDTRASKPEVRAVQEVSVELTDELETKLAGNEDFDLNVLKATLNRTLSEKKLLDKEGSFDLDVVLNDVRVRSTFSAVMWGFMAGDDHLTGKVTVLDIQEDPIYDFTVNASYALGGLAGGQDTTRMGWLYKEFSRLVAEELIAVRDKPGIR